MSGLGDGDGAYKGVFRGLMGRLHYAPPTMASNTGGSLLFLCAEPRAAANPFLKMFQGFPGGSVVENLPANAGDTGSSPGLGRSHMPRSN